MKKILQTIKHEQSLTPPLWLMRQAGRYLPEYRAVRANAGSFLSLCYTPDLATEVTLQPIRRFDFDAAIIFSDILVIAEALGQKLWFVDGEGPRLESIKDINDIQNLKPDRIIEFLSPVFSAIKQTRNELDQSKALIGFCGAPFTVASYMIAGKGEKDLLTTRRFAYQEPEVFDNLLDILAKASAIYLAEKIKSGADIVQIFDSWIGILDPVLFARFGIKPMVTLVNHLRAICPDTPIIAFPRGAHSLLSTFVEKVKPDVISLDWTADLSKMKAKYPNMVFQGNLDPLALTVGGEGLGEAIDHCLLTGGANRFIFNLGHGIRPETPIVHVERLVERVQSSNL